MPKVVGVEETALYVSDLTRSRDFYQSLFDFPEILREHDRLLALGIARHQVLLLFARGASTQPTDTPGGRIPPHDGSGTLHLAFRIEPPEIAPWREHLTAHGVPIESEVDCPGGGHSIYFRDPDGHAIELITPGCWAVDR